MAETRTGPAERPEDEVLEPEASAPLLRDPPAPPGYTNPVEENEVLENPFTWGGDLRTR